MALEVRQSDDQGFYNLVEIDDEGNETVLATEYDVVVLKERPELQGKDISPILESEAIKTRQETEVS